MRTRNAAIALAGTAILTMAACSSNGTDATAAPTHTATSTATLAATTAPTATVAPTSATASVPSSAATPYVDMSTGDPGIQTLLAADVSSFDPVIAADPSVLLSNGREQCKSMYAGAANPDHVAAELFGTKAHPITDAEGKLINEFLKRTVCPPS